MNEDADLLERYAAKGDEAAFAEFVRRHVNLVYSVALRQVNGDAHLAADAVQLVFADLARKAAELAHHRVLAAWLFTSARFAAAKLVRGEQRRHAREHQAHVMQTLNEAGGSSAQLDWQRVRPVLDEVIGELAEDDREAILLRFFEGRDFASIGTKLNLAANTARMRVDRALDKLRAQLERRGVSSTSAALAAVLADQAVVAAPAGLAATVTGAALVSGAAAAGAGLASSATGAAVATGATFMSIAKLQIGLAGAITAAGATGFVLQTKTNAALQEEVAALRRETAAIETLRAENRQLARNQADAADMRRDDAEFSRLQQEAIQLRARLQQLAREEQQRAAAQQREVFDPSKLDIWPAPRFQARPQYPALARSSGLSGEVVVEFIVDQNGDVANARAVRSGVTGGAAAVKPDNFSVVTTPGEQRTAIDDATRARLQAEFEAAAVEAVSKWKFKPGRKSGWDVATRLQVPIVFSVGGK